MGGDLVRVDGVQQLVGELAERGAAGEFRDLLALLGLQFAVQTREAAGEGGEGVFVALAEGDAEQELIEADGGLAFQRAGVGLVALADADGIDDDEVGLGVGVCAGDGLQVGGR